MLALLPRVVVGDRVASTADPNDSSCREIRQGIHDLYSLVLSFLSFGLSRIESFFSRSFFWIFRYVCLLPIQSILFSCSVGNLRARLAAAVPQHDQILLLGPPYKVPKDASLQSEEMLNALRLGDAEDDPTPEQQPTTRSIQQRSLFRGTERSGARRIFLFSKQALSENAPEPHPCHLEPVDLTIPDQVPPGPSLLQSSTDQSKAPSPLHQALEAYERQFMLELARGRVLADGADLRLQACRSCVQEQAVMARALRAAVSNLSDHYNNAQRTRADFTHSFSTKSGQHANLLQRFERILADLASIRLHSSLVSIARSSGRTMETLLDTVPVERERNWVQQCQTSHQRLVTMFGELDSAFDELAEMTSTTSRTRQEESELDRRAEEQVEALWNEVEGSAKQIRDRQSQRLERLTADHAKVVKIIMDAVASDSEDQVQAAFTPLREISNATKTIVPDMMQDDAQLKSLMERIAANKTDAMKRMKVRLRNVSIAQSHIQRVLSNVGVLRDALTQQQENMVHLEHVAELPTAYNDYLIEIQRRRAFGQAVTSQATAMMERIATMRDDEVKARDKFLRGPGRHLMPAFYEIFTPTLASPPPLFTPHLPSSVEMDALPDVGSGASQLHPPTGQDEVMQEGTAIGGSENPGVSSASSLTAESQKVSMDASQGGKARPEQEDQRVIVSASEHSGADLILDPAGGAAADAEAKTLAYENLVLRQALERLGGKAPRTYIEEARSRDAGVSSGSGNDAETLTALRQELLEARAQAKAAKEALQATEEASEKALEKKSRVDDKISHSSFEVGDVGLFMPTGRGSGGKRTYLAFHTKCPYRFLSSDCIKGTPDFVLGRIVYQEELIAGDIGTDANPYGLSVGTKFWVLTVEVLPT